MDNELYLEREFKRMSNNGLSEEQISQKLNIPMWKVSVIKSHIQAYELFDMRTSKVLMPSL